MSATDTVPTLPAPFVLGIAMLALELGLRTDEVYGLVGVPPAVLHDPEGEVTVEATLALMEHLEARFPDPELGLRLAEMLPGATLGAVAYAARRCRTAGEVVEVWLRYSRVASAHRLYIRHGAVILGGVPELDRVVGPMDAVMAQAARELRALCGPNVLLGAELARPRPDDVAPFHAVFGETLGFDADLYVLHLDEAVLAAPPTPDPALSPFVQDHLAQLDPLERTEGLADILVAIEEEADAGAYHTVALAERLDSSVRDLQRRALAAGTTLGKLIDHNRERRACHLLAERRLTIGDVAFLVGYPDLHVFGRAFERWTGQSPVLWRRSHG